LTLRRRRWKEVEVSDEEDDDDDDDGWWRLNQHRLL